MLGWSQWQGRLPHKIKRGDQNVLPTKLILKPHDNNDSGEQELIIIDRTPFRVGRRADNDAQITRPDISGAHAELRFADALWWIEDKGSTNGTFVNGDRLAVSSPTRLSMGDIVYFATKGFEIVSESEAEEVSPFTTKVLGGSAEIRKMMDLLRVINEQRTFPHFQAIVDLKTNQPVAWEALGRAATAAGPVSAGPLFFLASQNKVEARLSKRFRESARQCGECHHCWPDNRDIYLFINLHPAEISDPNFLESMRELSKSNLRRWFRIVIEMPESWAAKTSEMQVLAKEIRKMGMLVAYDDFGQGASQIPNLISVPPDFVKLDRELISQIRDHQVKHRLVTAIVDACRDLKARTIAEGIETQAELEACINMNIDLGQGYLLARPQPPFEIFRVDPNTLPKDCPYVRLNLLPSLPPTQTE